MGWQNAGGWYSSGWEQQAAGGGVSLLSISAVESHTGFTQNFTTFTASGNLMLVCLGTYASAWSDDITGVVWDPTGVNQTLTALVKVTPACGPFDGGGVRSLGLSLWELVGPAAGAKTLQVTTDGGSYGVIGVMACFSGANAVTVSTSTQPNVNTANTLNLNVSSAVGHKVLGFGGAGSGVAATASISIGGNADSTRWGGGGVTYGGISTADGASTVACTVNTGAGNDYLGMIGVDIAP